VGDAGTRLAWSADGGQVTLPVYEHWSFGTGPAGDFELLAEKLRPLAPNETADLGVRLVAIEPVASFLQEEDDGPPLFAPLVARVPTAIARPGAVPALAPGAAGPRARIIHRRLKELVDVTASNGDAPIVGPPLYGRWHAGVTSIDDDPGHVALAPPAGGGPQAWIEQLNADPEARMAAGVGTLVVQHGQEELMAEAWTQLESVLAANRRVRWAQLFASTGDRLHARLDALDDARQLRLIAPALGRLRAGRESTAAGVLDTTNLPRAVLGAPFARAARFASRATARRLPRGERASGRASPVGLVEGAVKGYRRKDPDLVPARFRSSRAVDPEVVTTILATPELSQRVKAGTGAEPRDYITRLETARQRVADLAPNVNVRPRGTGGDPGTGIVFVRPGDAGAAGRLTDALDFARAVLETDPDAVDPGLSGVIGGPGGAGPGPRPAVSPVILSALNRLITDRGDAGSPAPVNLASSGMRMTISREAAKPFTTWLRRSGTPAPAASALTTVLALRLAVMADLGVRGGSPAVSIIGQLTESDSKRIGESVAATAPFLVPAGARIEAPTLNVLGKRTVKTAVKDLRPRPVYDRLLDFAHRKADGAGDFVRQRTPSHPIMAAPTFPGPTLERLRAVDPAWVLGGLDELPPNSICLMEPNPRFVEAFLVGANHEMARELLWRGFPTDLRGTCFSRFWPAVAPGGAGDIPAIHTWQETLGRNGLGTDRSLTLVVIKGDLLRRYPSAIVTAEKGVVSGSGAGTSFRNAGPAAPERFRGCLDPDITYVALDIDVDVLRESGTDPREGWYISLRQPVDEPAFGLDVFDFAAGGDPGNEPDRHDEWTWEGLPGAGRTGVAYLRPQHVFAADNSGVAASRLFQRPFRLLLRAADYLPPGG
jgi:hypothetical protein